MKRKNEKKVTYTTDEIIEFFKEFEKFGYVTIPECECVVEPDGTCEHGNKSPLLELNLI